VIAPIPCVLAREMVFAVNSAHLTKEFVLHSFVHSIKPAAAKHDV
jgi:hypothetical protein